MSSEIARLAIARRKKELEMLKMKSEMKGENLINIVKFEWLGCISAENAAIDKELGNDQNQKS